MEGYRLRNLHGETIDPRQPLPVDSVEAQETSSVSPTLTYNGKAAAGAITINSLKLKPIISIEGDQVASYWGSPQNKVYEALGQENKKKTTHWFTSFTETAASADFAIYDLEHNLENMFESANSTVKRFVVKATDKKGHILYGWIKGISVSGDIYTFEVCNNRLTETRSWVGNTTDFLETSIEKIEIFHYNSSLSFGTGTALTEEVVCPKEYSKSWDKLLEYANSLSNGQFFVDYMRARIIGKKADTTASETVTYNIWASTGGGSNSPASNVNVVGGSTGTPSNVASSASSVTILAANSSRLGATIYNDSTQVLYLLLGSGTASSSNYSVQLVGGAYYEVPFNFKGQLTGIWASASGNARVTELT